MIFDHGHIDIMIVKETLLPLRKIMNTLIMYMEQKQILEF